ncbi:hypothetical protein BH11BAC4_BH11BAC4_03230 [soil metagenome]
MQIRFKYPLLFSILAVFMFTSCSKKTNKEGRYIPSDASFAVHMNGQSMSAKLPWEEIKQSELFKDAYSDTTASPLVRSVMENPDVTGVDVKNDIVFFMVKDGEQGYIVVEGGLKDAAKFKQFNKEANKNLAVETEKGGISYSEMPEVTTGWTKEKFILLMDVNMSRRDGAGKNTKSRIGFAEKLFNLDEDKSLGKDEKFSSLMKTPGDIHFWLNLESLTSDDALTKGMGGMNMLNLKKIYEGSRVTGTMTFENGKINADFKSYSNKEMTDLIKKYSGDKINADMIKQIPTKNLGALFAFNFKPEGLKEYLKLLGVDGFANMGASRFGFNLDDFIKANKGDILLAVSDVKIDSSGKPEVNAFFSASIGDKPSFTKLVEAGKNLSRGKFDGVNGPSMFSTMNDKYFAIGTNQQTIDTYIAGTANNSFDFLSKISGSSGGAYINFQYLMTSMGAAASKDSLSKASFDASIKMWDNMVAYGEGFNDGGSTQHIEINLVDKSTNSLKQLNNYMATLGKIQKIQKERFSDFNMNRDQMRDSIMREFQKKH